MAKIVGALVFVFSFAVSAEEKFEVVDAQFGDKQIALEVADTPAKREQGLMYRHAMAPDRGMLFIFDFEQTLRFWMKNTFLPLSIAYLDSNLCVFNIQDMEPISVLVKGEPTLYPSPKPARFALEMNKGWFKKNNVGIGAQLKLTGKKLPPSLKAFKPKDRTRC